jgi:3-phenylpropionate/trans-cinnamate dioxygenase ferredoxin reductase subunit
MHRLSVDLELCEGYGNCVFEADDYCELGEDDTVVLLQTEVAESDLERVQLAVGSCPVSALLLTPGQGQ